MATLTYRQWQKVLHKAFRDIDEDDGFLSRNQLMAKTGLGEDAIMRRIHRGIDEGWIESERRLRKCKIGPIQPVYVYRIKEDKFTEIFGDKKAA